MTPETGDTSTYGRTRSSSSSSGSPGADTSTTRVVDQAKQTISNVAGQAGDKVVSTLDGQKDRAAEGLGSVAQALRQTGDQLRDKDQGAAHQYVSSAADQMERLSGYLRSTNVREIVSSVERFARDQPALFLGSAFLLGVLGARFMKSSSPASYSSSGSIPRNESLVSQGTYSGMPNERQSYGLTGQSYGNDRPSYSGQSGNEGSSRQSHGAGGTQVASGYTAGTQGGSGAYPSSPGSSAI